jgi:hypothetical protein
MLVISKKKKEVSLLSTKLIIFGSSYRRVILIFIEILEKHNAEQNDDHKFLEFEIKEAKE